jgi:hypothetical protein
MNASKNSKLMNSLLPLNSGWFTPKNGSNTSMNSANSWFPSSNSTNTSSTDSWSLVSIGFFLAFVGLCIGLIYYFKDKLTDTWNNANEVLTGYFNPKAVPPPSAEAPTPGAEAPASAQDGNMEVTGPSEMNAAPSVMNKIMPGSEVFNISSNKYTYNDAEPLCKALGAELATYDQVKDAWNKGADWCNYGWVKGQMAVYPTSEETYQKIQSGPEEGRQSCGRPGLNGGYFDNPEMRFGVTCVGNKPLQKKHDEAATSKGAPISPDALAFDKKVSQFKSEADHIAVLPFNNGKWSS